MPDISVEVERYPESNWTETVPSDGLQDWVSSKGLGPGVTLTVPRPDGEMLLVAVDGGQAFLGLDRMGELYQFTYDTHGSDEDQLEIEISGQATSLPRRLIIPTQTAAVVTSRWFRDETVDDIGRWEHC